MANMMRAGLVIVALLLSGCVPTVLYGTGKTAEVIAQERTAGDFVDDASILFKIKQRYLDRDTNDMFVNVEVKVTEGRVLLTGNVDKPETRIEAERIAWEVYGVKEIANEIQFNDQSGLKNYALDVWISTEVRTRLLLAKNIRSVNYSVGTVNQVVYLMGIAQDQDELDRAINVAATTQYVQQVVSHVVLKDDPRRHP